MSKLAKEFGISDVGLAKACRRVKIPTPPVGHWAKVAHGKSVARPPLPESTETRVVLSPENHTRVTPAADVKAYPALKVVISTTTEDLAPVARATFAHLSKRKPTGSGFLICRGPTCFSCSVTSGMLNRTALILDGIERALPAVRAKVLRGEGDAELAIEVEGQPIVFSIAEKYTRTSFVPEKERNSAYPLSEFEYHAKGELKLTIDGYFEGRKSWSDGARARLEDKLDEVVAGIAGAAKAIKRREEEQQAQKKQWEEETRVRQAREEMQRKRLDYCNSFAEEAAAWQRHRHAMEYLNQLKLLLAAENTPLPDASAAWLAAAQQAVDDLDPMRKRVELLRSGYQPRSWEGLFGVKVIQDPVRSHLLR
jgi:hypothetical protein